MTTANANSTAKYRMLLALACDSTAISAMSLETVIAVCVSTEWDYEAAKANLLSQAESVQSQSDE